MSKISNRPDPNAAFPNPKIPSLCYIKNVVKNPRIVVGDYTYYERRPIREARNALLRFHR